MPPARRVLALVALLAPLSSSTLAQQIKFDYDHDVDFSKYKTIGWSAAQQPAKNAANHVRITRAVEQAFAKKGLAKAQAGPPDAFLMYHARIGDSLKVTGRSAGSYWEPANLRTMVDLNKVKEGTLVLEMYDARTREVVWRAVASDAAPRLDAVEEQINAAVAKMLENYPPAPKKPEPEAKP